MDDALSATWRPHDRIKPPAYTGTIRLHLGWTSSDPARPDQQLPGFGQQLCSAPGSFNNCSAPGSANNYLGTTNNYVRPRVTTFGPMLFRVWSTN